MFLTGSLIILAIGLPLAGALAVRLVGQKRPRVRHWLAVIIFGASGLIALALFLIEKQFACVLASGAAGAPDPQRGPAAQQFRQNGVLQVLVLDRVTKKRGDIDGQIILEFAQGSRVSLEIPKKSGPVWVT